MLYIVKVPLPNAINTLYRGLKKERRGVPGGLCLPVLCGMAGLPMKNQARQAMRNRALAISVFGSCALWGILFCLYCCARQSKLPPAPVLARGAYRRRQAEGPRFGRCYLANSAPGRSETGVFELLVFASYI